MAEKQQKKKAFEEPVSPLCGFRNLDFLLRILSTLVCITILVLGGISASHSGVILIGILGPPAAVVILWSLLQFGLSTSKFEYMNFRSRFRMVIGVLITIGFGIAVICCGLFKRWWGTQDSTFSYSDDPETSKSSDEMLVINLTTAGLALGCVGTYVFMKLPPVDDVLFADL
ncbi:hypothetical protein QQS21_003818 [Conoideocrella luteorostrata]|uniref:Uncharacterized protein n=1 Tax=Conoideocrella luteorostrata TaxID=1105319 RepID=A0AAJ0CSM4_9HYPO|nr:hypothetical protein QQS21_003818 [Conoideocrella luteorostrata]